MTSVPLVRALGPILTCILTCCAAVHAQEPAPHTSVRHALDRLSLARAEIDVIRFEMGKPTPHRLALRVHDVEPREVYHLAVSLYRKADRLAFELTRRTVEEPAEPGGGIGIDDVGTVLDAVLGRLHDARGFFDSPQPDPPSGMPAAVTLEALLLALMHANSELNGLLHREFSPEDVFQQVSLALSYTTTLSPVGPGWTMPSAPPLERGRVPGDVYRRLLACMEKVRFIAELSDLHVLQLDTSELDFDAVVPEHVYELASLLVAELTALHHQAEGAREPYPVYAPGRKFPSDVYRRAGLLLARLTQLESGLRSEAAVAAGAE